MVLERMPNAGDAAGPGGPRVAPPAPVVAPPGGNGHVAADGVRPLFGPMTSREQLETALPILGISPQRAEMRDILGRLQGNPLPYQELWPLLRTLKSLEQWRRKLVNSGVDQEDAAQLDIAGIGHFIYRRLNTSVEFSDDDLQADLP